MKVNIGQHQVSRSVEWFVTDISMMKKDKE